MKIVRVNTSKKYDCIIGGKIDDAGKYALERGLHGKALVVTDDNVAPLYLGRVKESLSAADFDVYTYIIEHGEKSKNMENFSKILNFLAKNSFTRKDTVFALGGGVVGDLSGFCAASYMRGISYVQLPTSLLAAVDSSVGGKTAIDLDCGKNLVGALWQPVFVLHDVSTLKTLPKEFVSDGFAEVIKYAFIRKSTIVEELEKENPNFENIICECIRIKADVVSEDEKENGIRKILNFGHTAAHSIEVLSDYTVSHGHAVAIGMSLITRAWEKQGKCGGNLSEMLEKLCSKFDLDTKCRYSAKDIASAAVKDKKSIGGRIEIIVPKDIGICTTTSVTYGELEKIIDGGIV